MRSDIFVVLIDPHGVGSFVSSFHTQRKSSPSVVAPFVQVRDAGHARPTEGMGDAASQERREDRGKWKGNARTRERLQGRVNRFSESPPGSSSPALVLLLLNVTVRSVTRSRASLHTRSGRLLHAGAPIKWRIAGFPPCKKQLLTCCSRRSMAATRQEPPFDAAIRSWRVVKGQTCLVRRPW